MTARFLFSLWFSEQLSGALCHRCHNKQETGVAYRIRIGCFRCQLRGPMQRAATHVAKGCRKVLGFSEIFSINPSLHQMSIKHTELAISCAMERILTKLICICIHRPWQMCTSYTDKIAVNGEESQYCHKVLLRLTHFTREKVEIFHRASLI